MEQKDKEGKYLYQQLETAGLANLCAFLEKNPHGNGEDSLKLLFGEIDESQTDLSQMVGFPMWMIKLADEFYPTANKYRVVSVRTKEVIHTFHIIAWLKRIFSSNLQVLISMDEAEFSTLLMNMGCCLKNIRHHYPKCSVLDIFYETCETFAKINGVQNLNDYLTSYNELCSRDSEATTLYLRCVQICDNVHSKDIRIKTHYKFDSSNDLWEYLLYLCNINDEVRKMYG